MTANPSIDPARFLHEELAQASPDLMRELLGTFINALLSAQADSVCGAEYGTRSEDRTNRRNGYRHRDLDTRAGTLDVAIPKLREGTFFPDWLLTRHRRAEAALTTVVATCYLLGVSTRRMDKLVRTLGITGLSKSQVSVMAKDLDEQVAAFRTRPLDEGPYTFVAADALTMKVREGGRVVKVAVMVATGVNADGYREVLGINTATAESGAGWLAFFRDLVARGLTGVALVTSDAHAGLVEAIGATLPAAAWQRCRTHYAANLMSITPKSQWGWVKALLHSCTTSPTPPRCTPSSTGSWRACTRSSRRSRSTSRPPARTSSRSPSSRRRSGVRSGPTTPTSGSTVRSAAAPTSWASSPTATRSSASSGPSWPSSTTSGPSNAATSASKPSRTPEPS